jgi:hypothetical protein
LGRPVALGIRDHSGWAALVALSGGIDAPAVIDRRRLWLLEPGMPTEPYHAVAGIPADVARPRLRESYESALRCARNELAGVVADLGTRGYEVLAMGGGVSGSPVKVPLERVLRAHPLLHASEGELFRDVLAEAAESLGLAVRRVPWKEVWAQLEGELGPVDGRARVNALGAALGPPWAADQKEACAAAWLALAQFVQDA